MEEPKARHARPRPQENVDGTLPSGERSAPAQDKGGRE